MIEKIKNQYQKRSSYQKKVIHTAITVLVASSIIYIAPYSAHITTPVYYIGNFLFGESMANVYAYSYVSKAVFLLINAVAVLMVVRVFMKHWSLLTKKV